MQTMIVWLWNYFSVFSLLKVLFLPFSILLFEMKSLWHPIVKKLGLSAIFLNQEYTRTFNFGILHGRFVYYLLFICLLIQLSIYISINSWIFISYFGLYPHTSHDYFLAQSIPALGIGSSFTVGYCVHLAYGTFIVVYLRSTFEKRGHFIQSLNFYISIQTIILDYLCFLCQ